MTTTTTRIAIVGGAHSGLCMGMQLKLAGIHDFVVLEKASTLGGTWRDNTYPGASCDAPSFLYSFSFAQKTDWSRRFAWQPELLGYSVECAVKHGLLPHFRFDTRGDGRALRRGAQPVAGRARRRRRDRGAVPRDGDGTAPSPGHALRSPAARTSAARSSTLRAGIIPWTSRRNASP